jgi:acetylornithine/succinyldiaminopimelate/putrescine aminotransferase
MHQQNFAEKTSSLETLFCEYFSQPRYQAYGIKLDGMGGLLSLSFKDPSFSRMPDIYLDVLRNGVITSHTQHYLRLTPPLTIDLVEFERGLDVIGKSLDAFCAPASK